ncbi:hypothetical protein Tco_0320794 [Tanacetum coccineum]
MRLKTVQLQKNYYNQQTPLWFLWGMLRQSAVFIADEPEAIKTHKVLDYERTQQLRPIDRVERSSDQYHDGLDDRSLDTHYFNMSQRTLELKCVPQNPILSLGIPESNEGLDGNSIENEDDWYQVTVSSDDYDTAYNWFGVDIRTNAIYTYNGNSSHMLEL